MLSTRIVSNSCKRVFKTKTYRKVKLKFGYFQKITALRVGRQQNN